MRKLFSILLISCIFIYESGYQLLFIFQQAELKEQMRAYISAHPGEYSVVFSFEWKNGEIADPDFKWVEKGSEFTYRGQMYDVVISESKDGKRLLHVFNDEQEAHLVKKFNGHSTHKQNPALLELASMIFTVDEIKVTPAPLPGLQARFFHSYSCRETPMVLAVHSPPPKVV